MKRTTWILMAGIIFSGVGLLLIFWGSSPPAAAAPETIPADAEQFTCYHFGLTPSTSWDEPDQCYSYALGVDPFSGGLTSGKKAIITDWEVTPTTSTSGSYYVGLAQATTGGSRFNPQVFLRNNVPSTIQTHTISPILVIDSGNVMNFFNDPTSPGAARFYVQGYIVSDLTVNVGG